MERDDQSKSNKKLSLAVLILNTVIFGVLFIPCTIGALATPITTNFQQKRIIEVVEVYFLAFYFLSYPLVIMGSLITAWLKYHKEAYGAAVLVSLFPFAYYVFYLFVELLFDGLLKSLPMFQ